MPIFTKVKTAKTEKAEDRVGGGYKVHPSDVYDAEIRRMYGIVSATGSIGVTIEADLFTDPESDKKERLTKTLYVTNSAGENFYEKDGKRYTNTNWLIVDAIAMFATDCEFGLGELETEEIFISRKDEDGKDIQVAAESYPEVEGLELKLAILHLNSPKQKKVNGQWVDTDEMVDSNEIAHVFNMDSFTFLEWEAEREEPEFIDKWEKQWKGKVKNIKPKAKPTTRTGGTGRGAAATRTTRGSATPTKSATGRESRFTRK